VTGDCHAGILWEPGGEIPSGDPTSCKKYPAWSTLFLVQVFA